MLHTTLLPWCCTSRQSAASPWSAAHPTYAALPTASSATANQISTRARAERPNLTHLNGFDAAQDLLEGGAGSLSIHVELPESLLEGALVERPNHACVVLPFSLLLLQLVEPDGDLATTSLKLIVSLILRVPSTTNRLNAQSGTQLQQKRCTTCSRQMQLTGAC